MNLHVKKWPGREKNDPEQKKMNLHEKKWPGREKNDPEGKKMIRNQKKWFATNFATNKLKIKI
jgi:hypothetical protein